MLTSILFFCENIMSGTERCNLAVMYHEKETGKVKYYISYTIAFFIVSLIVFLPFLLRGNNLVSAADSYNQFYPTYTYISQYIKEFFQCLIHRNSIPMFDFSIGFGNDIITTLNYYGLGDIFYITAFLASKQSSEVFLTLTILLKIYAAGISFSIWGRYHQLSSPALLAASIFYAFSGFTYSFGLLFPTFMLAQVTLPLFILGLDMLIEADQTWKISKVLILSIFIQALNGFYFLYMETVFGIIYFLVRFFVLNRKKLKKFIFCACNAVWQYLLGIGMASFFFVPVLLEFLKSPRSEETSFSLGKIIELYPIKAWCERLEGLLTAPGYGSGLGLCAIAVVCIIFIYSTHKYTESKILFLLLGVSYCLPITGSIMNGFSYSTERWLFLLYFLIASIIARILPELEHISNRCLILPVLIFTVWIAASFAMNGVNIQTMLRILIVGVSWSSVLYVLMKKVKLPLLSTEGLLSILAITGVILVGVFNNYPVFVGGKGFSAMFLSGDTYEHIADSKFAQYAKADSLNKDVLRTDIYDTCQNAGTIINANGTSSYYSITNPSIYYFLNEYIVSPGIEGSSFTFTGLDSRLSLEMLLSVGSYTDTIEAQKVYANPYVLPLGFTFDSYILTEDAQNEDVLDRNAALIDILTLDTPPQSKSLIQETQLTHQWQKIEITPTYENIHTADNILTVNPNSIIHIPLNETELSAEKEYYLYFNSIIYMEDEIYQDIDIEGKKIRLRPLGSYSGQNNTFMVKVPLTPELLKKKSIDIFFPSDGIYSLDTIELRALDISTYAEIYQDRKEVCLQNLTITGNEISGTIHPETDKLLFMSIPYSSGWKCYVDKNETPIIKANIGFCAVEIPAGEHTVIWKYCTPGLKSGLLVSMISWLLFILLLINSKISRRGFL